MSRAEVLRAVAAEIPGAQRPLLVAIDGPDGSGKTTFAEELAGLLRTQGRYVVRAGVDAFHLPRRVRHGAGRTAESVWSRHYDYRALRRELLDPWLAGAGDYRSSWHDVASDEHLAVGPQPVPADGILLLDGVFTQRDELRDAWDLTVFLDVPFETTVARMAARDGGPDDVNHPDQRRYIEAQLHYFDQCGPRELADVLVDNADLDRPRVIRPGPGRHAPAGWRREGGELVREVRIRADDDDTRAQIDRLAGD